MTLEQEICDKEIRRRPAIITLRSRDNFHFDVEVKVKIKAGPVFLGPKAGWKVFWTVVPLEWPKMMLRGDTHQQLRLVVKQATERIDVKIKEFLDG